MLGLKGKNVLVTGGASGIGQATAARFLAEGCAVCVLDSSAEAIERVTRELPDLAAVIEADVSSFEQVQAAMTESIETMGSVRDPPLKTWPQKPPASHPRDQPILSAFSETLTGSNPLCIMGTLFHNAVQSRRFQGSV